MRIETNSQTKFLAGNDDGDVVTLNYNSSPFYVLTGIGYKNFHVGWWDKYIELKTLQRDFTPVENFSFIEIDREADKYLPFRDVHKHNELDMFVVVTPNLGSNDFDDYEKYDEANEKFKVNSYYIKADDFENTKRVAEYFEKHLKSIEDNSATVGIVLKTMKGFEFKQYPIEPLDIDVESMYNDSFQPVHEHIVDRLNNTNKGVVMLHGLAGTGKTNYIRHLTTLVPKKRFVFIPTSMIPYLTDPSFISLLIDHKGAILVLEDCEKFIESRTSGDNNSVVSSILNLTDGILTDILDVQIICTFNSDLENIDTALLRKGRLIDEYKFDALSIEKSQKLINDLNIAHKVTSPMTLSEIFNISETVHKTETVRKIGFNNG